MLSMLLRFLLINDFLNVLLPFLQEVSFVEKGLRQWIGSGKWVPRALQKFDPDFARRLQVALVSFCQAGVKDDLIRFAEEALDSVGGRLFEGYSSGKRSA